MIMTNEKMMERCIKKASVHRIMAQRLDDDAAILDSDANHAWRQAELYRILSVYTDISIYEDSSEQKCVNCNTCVNKLYMGRISFTKKYCLECWLDADVDVDNSD